MSRQPRIPAPFQKLLPSIIRGAGPRQVVVAAGCAALLLVGGSSYLLSHTSPAPLPTVQQKAPLNMDTHTPATAVVLGATTSVDSGNEGVVHANNTLSSSAAGSVPANAGQVSTPTIVPCISSCSATTPTAPIQSNLKDVTKTVQVPLQGVLDLTHQLLGGL